jgi:SPP1 gp7 family putative phage head morphogenesis protein
MPGALPAAVQRLVLALAGTITDTIRQDIRDAVSSGLTAGESLTSVANRVGDLFTPRRAYTIAATEASRSMHVAEAEAAQEAGAAGLEWLASSDACDECLALDGKRAKNGDPFVVLTTGRAEYRTVYHAPRHPRCQCTCVPFWNEDK